jgi:hypothetical protein
MQRNNEEKERGRSYSGRTMFIDIECYGVLRCVRMQSQRLVVPPRPELSAPSSCLFRTTLSRMPPIHIRVYNTVIKNGADCQQPARLTNGDIALHGTVLI